MEKVFVYGTLKSGYSNHSLLKHADASFLGYYNTPKEYKMISLGGFPGVLEDGETSIYGEVYEVDSLNLLDDLEGYPDFYQRKLIETPYGDAYMYYLPKDTTYKGDYVVFSGRWD